MMGKTVTQTAQGVPDLSTLVAALTKAGLAGVRRPLAPVACWHAGLCNFSWASMAALEVASIVGSTVAGTLNDPNLVATVFAPTNEAFVALEKKLNYTADQLLNSSILKPTLLYHVVPNVAAQVRALHTVHVLPSQRPYMPAHCVNAVPGNCLLCMSACAPAALPMMPVGLTAMCASAQAASLTNNEVLPTLLPGQNVTIFLTNGRVVASGVQTAANVTQANVVADKVGTPLLPSPRSACMWHSSERLDLQPWVGVRCNRRSSTSLTPCCSLPSPPLRQPPPLLPWLHRPLDRCGSLLSLPLAAFLHPMCAGMTTWLER